MQSRMNIYARCLLLLLGIFLNVHAHEKKPWTLLVYMLVGNDSQQAADRDIEAMLNQGRQDNVNVIIYMTSSTIRNAHNAVRRLYVKAPVLIEVGVGFYLPEGIPTLFDALAWATKEYPSEHLAVVLWDQRGAFIQKGFFPWETSSHEQITDKKIRYVFNEAQKKLLQGKKIDIVAYDAPAVATLESLYAIKPYVDYVVGSQTYLPGCGFDYARVMENFCMGEFSSEVIARLITTSCKQKQQEKVVVSAEDDDGYGYEYTCNSGIGGVLSLFDMHKLDGLLRAHNQLTRIMIHLMQKYATGEVRNSLRCMTKKIARSMDYTAIDLRSFYTGLLKALVAMPIMTHEKGVVSLIVAKALREYNACVLENVQQPSAVGMHGLAVYFPYEDEDIDSWYYNVYWVKKTPWYNFLKSYVGRL